MQNQPIAWRKVALAILPGILSLAFALDLWRYLTTDLNVFFWSLMLLCVLLCAIGLVRERTLAVWSLPALGILLANLLFRVISLLNIPEASPFWVQEVLLLLLIVLYDTVPILVGLPLARKAGVLAGLIFVGAAYVLWDEIGDPAYGLGNSTLASFVSICPQLFFLILVPVTVMRLSSTRMRVVGYLVIISVALIGAAGIGAALSPYSSFARTIGLDFAFVVLPLLIALGLYAAIGRRTLASSPSSQS